MSDTPTIHETADNQYAVMLPCTKDDFEDFIAGLLGKGQTIDASVSGTFDISKDDLINLYHLVHQRVSQQNDGSLLQFSVRISYDDFSSVFSTLLRSSCGTQKSGHIRQHRNTYVDLPDQVSGKAHP